MRKLKTSGGEEHFKHNHVGHLMDYFTSTVPITLSDQFKRFVYVCPNITTGWNKLINCHAVLAAFDAKPQPCSGEIVLRQTDHHTFKTCRKGNLALTLVSKTDNRN